MFGISNPFKSVTRPILDVADPFTSGAMDLVKGTIGAIMPKVPTPGALPNGPDYNGADEKKRLQAERDAIRARQVGGRASTISAGALDPFDDSAAIDLLGATPAKRRDAARQVLG